MFSKDKLSVVYLILIEHNDICNLSLISTASSTWQTSPSCSKGRSMEQVECHMHTGFLSPRDLPHGS